MSNTIDLGSTVMKRLQADSICYSLPDVFRSCVVPVRRVHVVDIDQGEGRDHYQETG